MKRAARTFDQVSSVWRDQHWNQTSSERKITFRLKTLLCFNQVFGLKLVEIDTKNHMYILINKLETVEGASPIRFEWFTLLRWFLRNMLNICWKIFVVFVCEQEPHQSKDGTAVCDPQCDFHERRRCQREWVTAVQCSLFTVLILMLRELCLMLFSAVDLIWSTLKKLRVNPGWGDICTQLIATWRERIRDFECRLLCLFVLFVTVTQRETRGVWWREEGGHRRVCATKVRTAVLSVQLAWRWSSLTFTMFYMHTRTQESHYKSIACPIII